MRLHIKPIYIIYINSARDVPASEFTYRILPTSVTTPFRREAIIPFTFDHRLKASEVSFEDRQDLLGHKSVRITTHYSTAEIGTLIKAGNKGCQTASRKSPAVGVSGGLGRTPRPAAVAHMKMRGDLTLFVRHFRCCLHDA